MIGPRKGLGVLDGGLAPRPSILYFRWPMANITDRIKAIQEGGEPALPEGPLPIRPGLPQAMQPAVPGRGQGAGLGGVAGALMGQMQPAQRSMISKIIQRLLAR